MESQNVSFRVAREDLVTAVAWVARNLPTKPTQPVLRAMLITADDEGLELAGYDYDVSTRVRLSAEVSQPGRIAVAGKLLSEITGSLPNKPVDFRIDGSKAFVTCGSSRFELPLIPLDDYPMLPKLPAGTGSINAKLFTEAVSRWHPLQVEMILCRCSPVSAWKSWATRSTWLLLTVSAWRCAPSNGKQTTQSSTLNC